MDARDLCRGTISPHIKYSAEIEAKMVPECRALTPTCMNTKHVGTRGKDPSFKMFRILQSYSGRLVNIKCDVFIFLSSVWVFSKIAVFADARVKDS